MNSFMKGTLLSTALVLTTTSVGAEASTRPFFTEVGKDTVVYRLMPDKSMRPIATLTPNQRYDVVGVSGSYYQVEVDGRRTYGLKRDIPLKTTTLTKAVVADSQYDRLLHNYTARSVKREVPYYYGFLTEAQAVSQADSALNGSWRLGAAPGRQAVPDIATFDWERDIKVGDSTSFMFQAQYWMVLNQVTMAYHYTKDVKYLAYGKQLVEGWVKQYPTTQYKRYPNAYHQQGTAIRTFHLINFWNQYKRSRLNNDAAFSALVLRAVEGHGDVLSTPSFYRPRHNHGIFQDMALTDIAETFPELERSGEWRELAAARLTEQLDHSLSPDNVHLEHSPGYQVYTYEMLYRFNRWIEANGFTTSPRLEAVEQMPETLVPLIKPNRTLPLFGDTTGEPRTASMISTMRDYPHLLFAVTGGKEGVRPVERTKQLHTQYAVLREHWGETKPFADAVSLMMTAGFHNTAHKHQDDLSIDLYGYGRDFIVETGRFGYTNLPERNQAVRVNAHNTINTGTRQLTLHASTLGKSGILSVEETDGLQRATGYSELMGQGTHHTRSIAHDQAGTVLVADTVRSDSRASFTQRFHLGVGLEPIEEKDGETMFRDKEGRTLQVVQLPIASTGVMRLEPSFVAYRDFEWTPRHQVVSTKTGAGTSFVTLFHMSKTGTRVTFSHVTETESAYVVSYSLSDGRSRTIEMPKGEVDVPEEEIEVVEE
ncbi:heparinase II/III family protein [Exiguobacterium alkaliphilum]|uniref:heparinase II/III family protein n=1 Tax=Exiguobacterium alkaliphilum TaxID=1428684 RepID=UPI001BA93BFF|nr:heparinase II/III family protein [Exiguobacterium alkaliphilum]QUE87295.1 alginate lyase family protein [Exiguobacterium alkaliphilum]